MHVGIELHLTVQVRSASVLLEHGLLACVILVVAASIFDGRHVCADFAWTMCKSFSGA
jgi:hypothetical protein